MFEFLSNVVSCHFLVSEFDPVPRWPCLLASGLGACFAFSLTYQAGPPNRALTSAPLHWPHVSTPSVLS